jgi:endonuclease/exonuclease/phosphatase family metal-dependent hydrolase
MKFTLFVLSCLFSAQAFALTLGAYNIRNFDYDERYRIRTNKPALARILSSFNFDVISVEEINNTRAFEDFIQNSLPSHAAVLSECGGAHDQRLGFVYNKKTIKLLSFNEDLSLSLGGGCNDGSRPLAIALFENIKTKQRFYGMAAHLKSGSANDSFKKRTEQFGLIQGIINDLKSRTSVKEFFLAGDLNTTNYTPNGNDFRLMNSFLAATKMVNLTHTLGCSAYWWGGTDDGIETPSLLDHVIATPGLIKTRVQPQIYGHCQQAACRQVREEDLGVSYGSVSDHCPIIAKIQ